MNTTDSLDIAYIAIGAKQALVDAAGHHACDARFDGELGYIQACIDHAGLLDRVYEEQNGEFPGVWCYEVAEPFGHAYGKHLQQGGDLGDAERILREIVADGMKPITN